MKPLFRIIAVLSVLWMVSAAPQHMFLNNSAIGELKELTSTAIPEIFTSEKVEKISPESPNTESSSTVNNLSTSLESSTESLSLRKDYDEISDAVIDEESGFLNNEDKSQNDTSKNNSTVNTAENTFTSSESISLKPTENSETLNEAEIPITRYVPPLDPLKHMLMMADIKGMPNFSPFIPKVNLKLETTTTENPTSEEVKTNVNAFLFNSSHVIDVITESSEDVKTFVTEAKVEESTESIDNEENKETAEASTEKMFKLEPTEKNIPGESSERLEEEETTLDVTTEKGNTDDYSLNFTMEKENSEESLLDVTTEKGNSDASLLDSTTEKENSEEFLLNFTMERENTEESLLHVTTEKENSEESLLNFKMEKENSEESSLVVATEKENSEESVEKIIANESSEKVFSEPSEIEENEGESAEEVTNKDFSSTSSTVFMNSEKLTTVNTFGIPNDDNSTLTPTVHTEIKVDISEKPAGNEEKATSILKTSDAEIEAENTTDEMDQKTTEKKDEITSTTSISTEEIIKEEKLPTSDQLLKNSEELKIDILDSTGESTIISSKSDEFETEHDIVDTSTTMKTEESIFTTITTLVPEKTTKQNSYTSEPEAESGLKNISIDDEFEFRAVKFPENISKVSYVENETFDLLDPAFSDDNSNPNIKNETSTPGIFTTVAGILFSSTPTEATTINFEVTENKTPHVTNLTEKLPLKEDTDSDAVLFNDPSDIVTIESITPEVDAVPAENTSDYTPSEFFNVTSVVEERPDDKFSETIYPTSLETEDITEYYTSTATDTPANNAAGQNERYVNDKTSDNSLNNKNKHRSGNHTDMVTAVQFLHYNDKASSEQCFKLVNAHWNYATNITEENKIKQLEQTLKYAQYHKDVWKNATSFAWKTFNDTLLRRWFRSLSVLGDSALPEPKLNEFNRLKAEMKSTYSSAKICTYVPPEDIKKGHILQKKDCNLSLDPDLHRILAKSRDYDELAHVWKSWRDAVGRPIREKYLRFVELGNEAAKINGFSDIGEMWRDVYDSESFESDLEELWEQIRPLYEHLHAYVRRRLIEEYGEDKIKADGPIPAHLFGNMWAQSWVSISDITQPFPGIPSVNVTPIMQAKNMTAHDIFKISEEFFTSLGMKAMPEAFWKHSMIERPKDREIICHPSAWDFCNGKDYRIKMCTDITMEDLITTHHEMTHVQYFLQYARQPTVFREGANPGFHEAVGDTIALSVSTPKHLQLIGLLNEVPEDPEEDLNFLLRTALDKVSFLPASYLIERWRWELFSGDIKPEIMNTKWWEYRLKYQGVCPPVKRTDTDFDPGAKYHIPGHVPYIRYFVSCIIQFQFHKVLCDAAGHTGPLYTCDIHESKDAGQILSQVMELGSSEHWHEVMKIMTGGATNKMDAGPMLEYFEPLLNFLQQQNQNETVGWRSDDPTICP